MHLSKPFTLCLSLCCTAHLAAALNPEPDHGDVPQQTEAMRAWTPAPLNVDEMQNLQARRNQHPRLFIDTARLQQLKDSITGPNQKLWRELQISADEVAKAAPPRYDERDGEQLYQRTVGDNLATLSVAWLISREPRYLDAAAAIASASCQFPTWGLDAKTGKPMTFGLAYGHQLLGLSMLYDFAGESLPKETRALIHKTLIQKGTSLYEAYKPVVHPFLQNHTWINSTGLLAAGFATFDDGNPDAANWIAMARNILSQSTKMLSPDGASQEGTGYWSYGVEYLIKLNELVRESTGVDNFHGPFWEKTANYPLYMTTPRDSWRSQLGWVNFADCPRYFWGGPDHILRYLARRTHNGTAQWLANAMADARENPIIKPKLNSEPAWQNLVWNDPKIEPTPPDPVQTLHEFPDMGIVSARTDWSGQGSLFAIKCGPPLGRFATENFYDFLNQGDLGHVHPDAGHFAIFGEGEWLICNPGYVPRMTEPHNVLMIDGHNQLGQVRTWFSPWPLPKGPALPHVIQSKSSPEIDTIDVDATAAYDPADGLKHYVRHILFIKPNAVVVVDDIELGEPHDLALLFHPEAQPMRSGDNIFLCHGEKATLQVQQLTPSDQPMTAGVFALPSRHPNDQPLNIPVLTAKARSAHWRNAVAFTWATTGQSPPTVELKQAEDDWAIVVSGHKFSVHW